jgi:hypothetical protein
MCTSVGASQTNSAPLPGPGRPGDPPELTHVYRDFTSDIWHRTEELTGQQLIKIAGASPRGGGEECETWLNAEAEPTQQRTATAAATTTSKRRGAQDNEQLSMARRRPGKRRRARQPVGSAAGQRPVAHGGEHDDRVPTTTPHPRRPTQLSMALDATESGGEHDGRWVRPGERPAGTAGQRPAGGYGRATTGGRTATGAATRPPPPLSGQVVLT